MKCRERLEQYLGENGVPFELITHKEAYTMPEVAAALHVPGMQVAKVVIAKADGKMAMLVVPSPYRLDFDKVRGLLDVENVGLAAEEEFAEVFPDCAIGAMPPFGNLYGVPIYVDEDLTEETDIVFRVGTHREVMKVAYADFARLAEPTVAKFAAHP